MSKLITYKKMRTTADARGCITTVQRFAPKSFGAIINGEIKKVYKQRRSCYAYFCREFRNRSVVQ